MPKLTMGSKGEDVIQEIILRVSDKFAEASEAVLQLMCGDRDHDRDVKRFKQMMADEVDGALSEGCRRLEERDVDNAINDVLTALAHIAAHMSSTTFDNLILQRDETVVRIEREKEEARIAEEARLAEEARIAEEAAAAAAAAEAGEVPSDSDLPPEPEAEPAEPEASPVEETVQVAQFLGFPPEPSAEEPEVQPDVTWTKDALRKFCSFHGIECTSADKKSDLLKRIKKFIKQERGE